MVTDSKQWVSAYLLLHTSRCNPEIKIGIMAGGKGVLSQQDYVLWHKVHCWLLIDVELFLTNTQNHKLRIDIQSGK